MKDKIVKHSDAYMRFSIIVNCCDCALAGGTVVNGTELSSSLSLDSFNVIVSADKTVRSLVLFHRTVAYRHACCEKREAHLKCNATYIGS